MVAAAPAVSVSCRTPAGIHSARVGGSTQAVCGPYGQHAAGGPRQLMVKVGVPVEDLTGQHRERRDENRDAVIDVGGTLSVLRHNMAAYALGLGLARS